MKIHVGLHSLWESHFFSSSYKLSISRSVFSSLFVVNTVIRPCYYPPQSLSLMDLAAQQCSQSPVVHTNALSDTRIFTYLRFFRSLLAPLQ